MLPQSVATGIDHIVRGPRGLLCEHGKDDHGVGIGSDDDPPSHRCIHHEEFEGLRVTPCVYTTPDEVDLFAEAMEQVIAKGLPA